MRSRAVAFLDLEISTTELDLTPAEKLQATLRGEDTKKIEEMLREGCPLWPLEKRIKGLIQIGKKSAAEKLLDELSPDTSFKIILPHLHRAVKLGDTAMAKDCLAHLKPPFSCSQEVQLNNILSMGMSKLRYDIINLFVLSGWNVMQIAIEGRFYPVIKKLLKDGADPEKKLACGISPFVWAVTTGNVDLVNIFSAALIERGINLQAYLDQPLPKNISVTPLIYAANSNDTNMVAALLKLGANPNISDAAGNFPLAIAVKRSGRWVSPSLSQQEKMKHGHPVFFYEPVRMVTLLLECKANPNQLLPDGTSLLYCAMGKGYPDIVEELLRAGANISGGAADTLIKHALAANPADKARTLIIRLIELKPDIQFTIEVNKALDAKIKTVSDSISLTCLYEIKKLFQKNTSLSRPNYRRR